MSLGGTLDPGKHSAAFSLYYGDTLVHAGFVQVEEQKRCRPHLVAEALRRALTDWFVTNLRYGPIRRAFVEMPKVYQTAKQSGDQADIRDLALVAGACALVFADFGAADDTTCIEPWEWKGDIKKDVTKHRVDSALSDFEVACIVWPKGSKKHNVYDAIHMGLRKLTRRRA